MAPRFPLPPNYFNDLTPLVNEDGPLSSLLNETNERIETVEGSIGDRQDLWIDGDNGDDANDGLTLATAVQSLGRLSALIPTRINSQFFVINMRGTISLAGPSGDGFTSLKNTLLINTSGVAARPGADTEKRTPTVIITGGAEVATHLDDGAGGAITSDINATGQIGLSTETWTENQHRGYWCDISSGPLAGNRYVVESHDATTLTLLNLQADPGAGAAFKLVKPATVIDAPPFSFLWLKIAHFGLGQVFMQDLHFTNGATFNLFGNSRDSGCQTEATNVIVQGNLLVFSFVCSGADFMFFGDAHWDTSGTTPVKIPNQIGVSVNANAPVGGIWLYNSGPQGIYWSVIPQMNWWYCSGLCQTSASRIGTIGMMDLNGGAHGGTAFGHTFDSAAYAKFGAGTLTYVAKFGGYRDTGVPTPSRPAIEMLNCNADFAKSVIENMTVGIRAVASKSVLQAPTGADHTVAGVHAEAGSFIALVTGTVPTLAGNSGTVELSKDGTTNLSLWSAISGTPVSDAEVICKEYIPPTFTFPFA